MRIDVFLEPKADAITHVEERRLNEEEFLALSRIAYCLSEEFRTRGMAPMVESIRMSVLSGSMGDQKRGLYVAVHLMPNRKTDAAAFKVDHYVNGAPTKNRGESAASTAATLMKSLDEKIRVHSLTQKDVWSDVIEHLDNRPR